MNDEVVIGIEADMESSVLTISSTMASAMGAMSSMTSTCLGYK